MLYNPQWKEEIKDIQEQMMKKQLQRALQRASEHVLMSVLDNQSWSWTVYNEVPTSCCGGLQWNPSTTDTFGDQHFIRYSEVSPPCIFQFPYKLTQICTQLNWKCFTRNTWALCLMSSPISVFAHPTPVHEQLVASLLGCTLLFDILSNQKITWNWGARLVDSFGFLRRSQAGGQLWLSESPAISFNQHSTLPHPRWWQKLAEHICVMFQAPFVPYKYRWFCLPHKP